MESLKSWGITVCSAALACGIAGIISPSGKLEKVYKFVLSLFMLCCLLLPVFTLTGIKLDCSAYGDKNLSGVSNTEFSSAVEQQQKDSAGENVSSLISKCCESCGVTPVCVNVTISESSGGTFSVGSAEVTIKHSDMQKEEKIKETVMKELSINIKIKEGVK